MNKKTLCKISFALIAALVVLGSIETVLEATVEYNQNLTIDLK